MGFMSKFKGWLADSARPVTASVVRPTSLADGRHTARNAVVRNDWLTLTQPGFFGRSHTSPNEHWTVGCNDSDGVSRGGHRECGNGPVVLAEQRSDRAVHELTSFARPMAAAVSDVGTYIVHDAGFGSTLKGDVIEVNLDGRERYLRHFGANRRLDID